MTKEQKEKIMSGIVWEQYPKRLMGGQHAGIVRMGFTISHPELDIVLSVNEFRSQSKTREVLLTMFEMLLERNRKINCIKI